MSNEPITSFGALVDDEIADLHERYATEGADEGDAPDLAKVKQLAALISKSAKAPYTYDALKKKKYILIDRVREMPEGSIPDRSGFLAVGPGEGGGIVYGTKAYGVANAKNRYGTVDELLAKKWTLSPSMSNPAPSGGMSEGDEKPDTRAFYRHVDDARNALEKSLRGKSKNDQDDARNALEAKLKAEAVRLFGHSKASELSY